MGERRVDLTLVAGAAVGLGMLAFLAASKPAYAGVDYRVYELAARAALRGEAFYDVPPAGFGFTYVYPPASVLLFVPLALLPGWRLGFALFTLAELATAAGVALVATRLARDAGATLDRTDLLAVAAYTALSGSAVANLFYAQVNHFVALSLGLGLLALDDGREWRAGALFALPAYLKVFPASVGVWLLRRRAWRGVAAAVATVLGAYGLGLLVFGPGALETYVDEALLARFAADTGTGAMAPSALYVTLHRPVSVLLPGASTALRFLVVLVVLAAPVGYCYRDCSTARRRLLAAHATLAAVVLLVPAYPTYLVFVYPTLLALPFVLSGWRRSAVLAGLLLVGLPVSLASVADAASLLGLGGWPVALLRPVFTFGSPPLYGLVLTLAACVAE